MKSRLARISALKDTTPMAILLETIQEWQRDKTTQIAGSLAFFVMLSLAPLLVITVSVLGLVTNQNTIQGEVYDQVANVVGERSADVVQTMVQSANTSHSGGIAALISGITLFFGAISVFGQLQEALNRVWDVEVKQNQGIWRIIKRRSLAATMLPVTGIVLLLAVILNTALSALTHHFGNEIPNAAPLYVLRGLSIVVSILIITFLLAMIYKYLPDVKIAWEDVLSGAAFTAVLFTIGQFLLSIYLTQSSVASTYGAAGTVMVLLLWIYYSAQIFLFGAEFTQVFARHRNRRIEPTAYAYRLRRRDQPAESTH